MNPADCETYMTETMNRCAHEIHTGKKPQELFANLPAMHHRAFAAALYILALIFIAVDCTGQTAADASQTGIPPGVNVQIKAIPEIATVGDSLQIDLDIAAPEGYQVQVKEPESQIEDFVILDFFPVPIAKEQGTPQEPATGTPHHHRARIIAAVYKTGKFIFPSLPISLTTPSGEEIALSSPALNIEIQSVLFDENPKLKDLKRQAEISEPVRWILWIIIALAAALLGATAWYCWRKRRERPVSRSPEQIRDLLEIAESDLKELLSQGFPKNGMVKKFYVLLSEIVKRILESGYEIHAAEKTTFEIMDSLNHASALETENRERIEYFLTRCDVVKFAKYVPSTAEHEAVSKDALRILEEVKKAVASRQSPVGSEKQMLED
jgi:hypothetical protein